MRCDPAIYQWFAGYAPFLVGWSAFFTLLTTIRIILMRARGIEKLGHSSALTELAALPLAYFQSACFVKAVLAADILTSLLFLWWGPGFVLTALYLALCALRKVKSNFYPYRNVISWLCKLNYLAFAIAFLVLGVPELLFVFSAWILNDQYGMAFLSLDADRLRRTFHDFWLIRALYPLGLLAPFVWPDMPQAFAYRCYGVALLGLWAAGIWTVSRRADLKKLPEQSTLLRNMVYFSKPEP